MSKVCAARAGTSLPRLARRSSIISSLYAITQRGEACPLWLGKPATAHWGIPDPAHVEGDEARRAAFKKAYEQLARRIQLFMSLPIEKLDKLALKEKLAEIGRIKD